MKKLTDPRRTLPPALGIKATTLLFLTGPHRSCSQPCRPRLTGPKGPVWKFGSGTKKKKFFSSRWQMNTGKWRPIVDHIWPRGLMSRKQQLASGKKKWIRYTQQSRSKGRTDHFLVPHRVPVPICYLLLLAGSPVGGILVPSNKFSLVAKVSDILNSIVCNQMNLNKCRNIHASNKKQRCGTQK